MGLFENMGVISGLSGGQNYKITNDPLYIALKQQCDGTATLAEKYTILGVENGFSPLKMDKQCRLALFLLYTRPYLQDGPDGTMNLALSMIADGLSGYIDESLWSWYEIDFGMPTIQEKNETSKTLPEALEAFYQIDGAAAQMAAKGVIAAGSIAKAEYGESLWTRLKEFLSRATNPFANPITGPLLTAVMWIGGLYLAIKIAGLMKKAPSREITE